MRNLAPLFCTSALLACIGCGEGGSGFDLGILREGGGFAGSQNRLGLAQGGATVGCDGVDEGLNRGLQPVDRPKVGSGGAAAKLETV